MKKWMFSLAAASLLLAACNDDEAETKPKTEQTQADTASEEQPVVQAEKEWEQDERLQEPAEDTKCAMCNMQVYTKDHEMGAFAAQAVKADGSTAFYDDIGCLLNAEFAHEEANEKFVRDYGTLNWFNVEQAYIVKTDLKSPMNWGYIFFKYEDDAQTFIDENKGAALTTYTAVRQEALERYKQKQAQSHGDEQHDMHGDMTHEEDVHAQTSDEQ